MPRAATKSKDPTSEPDEERLATIQEIRENEVADLRDYLEKLAGHAAIKINIVRTKPVTYKGVNTRGTLDTVDELIDEDYIKSLYGGGSYQLRVQKQSKSGSYRYFTSRNVEIAGPPKVGHLKSLDDVSGEDDDKPKDKEQAGLAQKAMETMERHLERAEKRADQQPRSQGLDMEAIRAINQPLIDQIQSSREEVAQMRSLYFDALGKKPDTSAAEKILDKMVDGESARIQALSEQHRSEMAQLRASHLDECKNLRAEHNRDRDRDARDREREISNLTSNYEGRIKALEVAFETRIESIKNENARLLADLSDARAKVTVLEQRKDKGLVEQATELATVQKTLSELGLGGSKDDDAEKASPWYQKVIDSLGNSSAAVEFIQKIGASGPPSTEPEPKQVAAPPSQKPQIIKGEDGERYVMHPSGQLLRIRKRKPQQAETETDSSNGDGRPPDPGEVKLAVQFLESAIRNGTTPEDFGASARSLIPDDILQYISRAGVDSFLDQVAQLETNSPLTTQRGRNFARDVARFLTTGTTEQAAEEPQADMSV